MKHRADIFALFLALAGFLASALVTQRIFEAIPHIEDEIAYVWQAKALAEGHLTVASPSQTKSLLVPFIVDYQGERFGKYPPGWPVLLSLAIELKVRAWVNPLMAGLGVWLTYLLGKRAFNHAGWIAGCRVDRHLAILLNELRIAAFPSIWIGFKCLFCSVLVGSFLEK